MALTKEQEDYLATLADEGLAEIADIADRNKQVELDAVNNAAIEAKKAELAIQAQELIDNGLEEFKATLPTELTK